jgi:anaerobic ribonucleoside-triphosphate reductase
VKSIAAQGGQCEYPQGNHLCSKVGIKRSAVGQVYCEWHWHQVLVNREFLFEMWEKKKNDKTLGFPDGYIDAFPVSQGAG